MGGRGASSGLSKNGKPYGSEYSTLNQSKPSYFKETEKAVQLKLSVYDYDLEQRISRKVWVPKSQLSEDGKPSHWITQEKAREFYNISRNSSQFSATWEDSKGNTFGHSVKKSKGDNSKKSYTDLVKEAKELGIKGIRVGLRRKTLEEKIKKHKSKL